MKTPSPEGVVKCKLCGKRWWYAAHFMDDVEICDCETRLARVIARSMEESLSDRHLLTVIAAAIERDMRDAGLSIDGDMLVDKLRSMGDEAADRVMMAFDIQPAPTGKPVKNTGKEIPFPKEAKR